MDEALKKDEEEKPEEHGTDKKRGRKRKARTMPRHRPRTKGLRTKLKTMIESAILRQTPESLRQLFPMLLEDGNFAAPFPAILTALGLDLASPECSKMLQLSAHALESVSNISRLFRITSNLNGTNSSSSTMAQGKEEAEPSKAVNVPKAVADPPHPPQLWLIVHANRCACPADERTVFVDNLPAHATRVKLERRCGQFGSLVELKLPQIGHIQWRISLLLGGKKPAHSGFAFVQFASKTAAKRFQKRYAANSRLMKRSHSHHHGPRHHGKRSRAPVQAETETAGAGDEQPSWEEQQQPLAIDDGEKETEEDWSAALGAAGQVDLPLPDELLETDQNQLEHQKEAVTAQDEATSIQIQPQPAPAEAVQFIAPSPCMAPTGSTAVGTSTMSISMRSMSSGVGEPSECLRVDRSFSVAESMQSVDESGRDETDLELEECASRAAGDKEEGEGKKLARKKAGRNRRKRRTAHQQLHRAQSLTSLFRHIQVFPLQQYQELRANYLRLKKARMSGLKGVLMDVEEECHGQKRTDQEAKAEKKLKEKPSTSTATKRRRKRGVRRLLDRAERAKTELETSGRK